MHEDIIHFPAAESTSPVYVSMAGTSYCDGSYHINRGSTDLVVLEYIVSGTGTLRIGKREFNPGAGDTYIIPTMTPHRYWSSSSNPWVKLWFNMHGSLVPRLLEEYGLKNKQVICGVPEMENRFREGLRKASASCCSQHDLVLIVHSLIASLAEVSGGQPVSREALCLKQFLDSRINGTVSLEEVAKQIHRSVPQSLRIFKKAWGISPYRYLIERKMQVARLMLENTLKPVNEIAGELGFKSEFHFSNLFKRKIGKSPRNFRNHLQEGQSHYKQ